MNQEPDSKLEALEFLIGTWRTEGAMLTEDTHETIPFGGTDKYEWVLNKQFILHTVDIMMGEEKVEALEMIYSQPGYPSAFIMTSFDNQGEVSTMAAQLTEEGRFIGAGNKMRFILNVVGGDKMKGVWERSEDNVNWKLWMTIELRKGMEE